MKTVEEWIALCLTRFNLIAGPAGVPQGFGGAQRMGPATGVVFAPLRDAEHNDLNDPVIGWVAFLGGIEARGETCEDAAELLYRELGKACKRQLGYHKAALRCLEKELTGEGE